jgi:hypothetical protein
MSMTMASALTAGDDAPPRRPEDARALLRDCFAQFASGLLNTVRVSIDTTDDLFEVNQYVTADDLQAFRSKREAWIERFDKAIHELFERRVSGTRRKGRRPDVDASVGSLRVLNEFDYEKQLALTRATGRLLRASRGELDALNVRVAALFNESATRDFDNPFSPDYILDAIGMTSRELYPNPRIWRSLMERVLADVSPFVTKIYITLNRFLGDHQVLPEIKAELRAKSELRPSDDAELFTLFGQLFKEVGATGEHAPGALPNVEVPAAFAPEPGKRPLELSGQRMVERRAPPVHASPYGTPAPGAQTLYMQPGAMQPAFTQRGAAPMTGTGFAATPTAPGGLPGSQALGEGAAAYGIAVPPGFAMLVPIGGQGAPIAVPSGLVTGLATARPPAAGSGAQSASATDFGFPQLDPLMALGSSSAIFATLEQWQHYDPAGDILHNAVAASDASASGAASATASAAPLPLDRIPYIRAAIADKFANPTDKITMDVIGLLFDYIFRDPSIPESLRELFGRLQVPILKAALLDRTFFSDKRHPARRLLDRLAAAAIAATSDDAYRESFQALARSVVDEVCSEFKVDIAVFQAADAKLQTFIESEQGRVAQGLDEHVAEALAAEEREADRAHVHIVLRDRLARLEVPPLVRDFLETVWTDYMSSIRAAEGESSPAWGAASAALDDLLWSITAKERTAQKARLTKLIPRLIGSLRKGCTAVDLPTERTKAFLESLYELHMAAIKAKSQPAVMTAAGTSDAKLPADGKAPPGPEGVVSAPSGPLEEATVQPQSTVRDFVSEMALGTWIAFQRDGDVINARLFWMSPLRTKYIFTTRTRGKALVVTPDQLAEEIERGTASLVIEPVPLFDRAVSAALDSLAARKPPANDGSGNLGHAA